MKEEVQGKLVEILSSIQSVAGKAGDFAMEQLPDVAQSFVAYGRAYATVISAAALLLVILSIRLHFWVVAKDEKACKQYESDKVKESGVYRSQYFQEVDIFPIPYVPAIVGLVLFFLNLSQLLMVWFAPKVWLLKEIAEMVR